MSDYQKLPAPTPMAGPDKPVDWMLAYKFNAGSFPGYLDDEGKHEPEKKDLPGRFGGRTKEYHSGMSQSYVYASSDNPSFQRGDGAIGDSYVDPLSATFAQVYEKDGYNYILWNDQFYDNPIETKGGPYGHSKGMAAWNQDGEGFVLQVSTPSWPASGNHNISRNSPDTKEPDSNTLGCVNDDDIEVAQHFFALKLTKDDLLTVLEGLYNSSVVTDTYQKALCNVETSPDDIKDAVYKLGKKSKSTEVFMAKLSSGITFISKPSYLAVPPWQMISAKLDGLDLRVVSWWANPPIYSTKAGEIPGCWGPDLGTPGDVDIALTGEWDGTSFSVIGADGKNSNHAKLGISKDSSRPISIFGDENQQGALAPGYAYEGQKCDSSQNGRGGTFYVLENEDMWKAMTALFKGSTAGKDKASTNLAGT